MNISTACSGHLISSPREPDAHRLGKRSLFALVKDNEISLKNLDQYLEITNRLLSRDAIGLKTEGRK